MCKSLHNEYKKHLGNGGNNDGNCISKRVFKSIWKRSGCY